MIADSFADISEFVNELRGSGNYNRDGDFLFTVTERLTGNATQEWNAKLIGQFFRGLWVDFDIFNPLFVVVQCEEDILLGYYDTFKFVGGYEEENEDDERNWGEFHWTSYAELYVRDYITGGYVNDFHSYPLRVNQFFRYPTAISRNFIPEAVRASYVYKTSQPDGKW